MSTESHVHESIERAADAVGPVWPLHSFVTANPLAGLEDRPFSEAVRAGEELFDARGFPAPAVFRRAWTEDRIDPEILAAKLEAAGYEADPPTLLDELAERDPAGDASAETQAGRQTPSDRVDEVLTKWLAAFLDEGTAHWAMPGREAGFYEAVRRLAPHDGEIPDGGRLRDLPDDPVAAIEMLLAEQPDGEWPAILAGHLAALPGWTGFIKRRSADGGPWQAAAPVSLEGYLAVRLALVDLFDAPVHPAGAREDPTRAGGAVAWPPAGESEADTPLPAVWLEAWEATYRQELVEAVSAASADLDGEESGRPAAQLVFCIDTRSEIIRRHVEDAGDYETHGFAGFFGIPMRWEGYDDAVTVDACPPILEAQHRIAARPTGDAGSTRARHDAWRRVWNAGRDLVDSLTTNPATAFSYVEKTGPGYGAAMALRTLLPARLHEWLDAAGTRIPDEHEFCEPTIGYNPEAVHELREGLTHEEQVAYAAAAFETMGWQRFARLVVFAGHGSETANNPFDASLDCGACAGNPGGPSARVLAAICNDDTVRASLRERGIEIPEDTVFVPAQHNTTTDEIELYDQSVPETHADDLAQLRADLDAARAGAAAERAGDMAAEGADGIRETVRRAADWAETRPEWGLAGNAAFVVGPRALTERLDLDGRSFLHSYDWRTDPDGDALETILTGPMVVTQWINTQYYFATVDTAVYGSGSKVTQNPVGNLGVYQGNGGDLATGLPLQSVASGPGAPYHQPLRLSTVIHAPVDRVTEVLGAHADLVELLDNDWLSVTVVDPTRNHLALRYDGDLTWTPLPDTRSTIDSPPTESAPPTVDD